MDYKVPNENKADMSPEKAQSILWNLLEAFEARERNGSADIPASSLVRLCLQVKRCEGFVDEATNVRLQEWRQGFIEFIDTYPKEHEQHRVLHTEDPEIIAAEALVHYHSRSKLILVSSLNWVNWLYYQVIYKAQRNMYIIGLPAGAYAARMDLGPTFAGWFKKKRISDVK